ncbi:MAG TPA: extracellular solute-binding protein [Ramlibacter sp.]|nr:extracellular solute-binding protein [Ramlibacter sp.]
MNVIKRVLNWTCAGLLASLPLLGQAQGGAPQDLDALVKAAQAEGEVFFYSGVPEPALKRIADAFKAKYGVTARFIRLPGNQVPVRYAVEAEAGNFAADLVLQAGDSVRYAEEGIKKGWFEPISAANIPAIKSGEFPAKMITGPTAVVQIIPWLIAFNTDAIKGADAPKDWRDMVNPKYKGRIILADPTSSDAFMVFWNVLLNAYGESFFTQLRAQNPRWQSSGVPSIQALAAGEGDIHFPAIPQQLTLTQGKGAPIGGVKPEINTGIETHTLLTARAKAKHPNAARLLVHYIMTPEGNKVFNADPGGFSIYDTSTLPKGYVAPTLPDKARQDQIVKLLGR